MAQAQGARELSRDEYRELTLRWVAAKGSGGKLADENFLPDRRTTGAWRRIP